MRKVEIYTGAYASGKSENALNRAIEYIKQGKDITLVDLDTVEPAYCMRPIEKRLKEYGINLILQSDYFGLGRILSIILAIIPFTAWLLGLITRFKEGKIVAGVIRIFGGWLIWVVDLVLMITKGKIWRLLNI